jgi:hypothetical protein
MEHKITPNPSLIPLDIPKTAPAQYTTQSRGYKTKGNEYKDRYVEKECPDCKNPRAYKDAWKTRVKYTCLKRNCRHVWFEVIERELNNDILSVE